MAVIKKWKIISVGEDVEILEPSYVASGDVKCYNCLENSLTIPQKLSNDWAIPLFDI